MEILQLRYFIRVAQLQHITKAAESLYITQPALSRSISRLEANVGVPLFSRVGMRIELNKSGQIFYDYAKQALDMLDKGMYLATDAHNQSENQIVVSASVPGVLPMYMDEYISKVFEREGSQPRFRASIKTPQAIEREILEGSTTFAICMFPSENARLEWIPLFDEELFVVLGQKVSNHYAPVEPLSRFAGESFVCNIDWENRRIVNEACLEAGFIPHVAVETNEILTYDVVQHIEYGIAMVPAHMSEELLTLRRRTPDKVCRVVSPSLRRALGIVKLKDKVLNGEEYAFFQSIIEKSRVLQEDVHRSAAHVAAMTGADALMP